MITSCSILSRGQLLCYIISVSISWPNFIANLFPGSSMGEPDNSHSVSEGTDSLPSANACPSPSTSMPEASPSATPSAPHSTSAPGLSPSMPSSQNSTQAPSSMPVATPPPRSPGPSTSASIFLRSFGAPSVYGNPKRAQHSGSFWGRRHKGASEGWPTGHPEQSGLCDDDGAARMRRRFCLGSHQAHFGLPPKKHENFTVS